MIAAIEAGYRLIDTANDYANEDVNLPYAFSFICFQPYSQCLSFEKYRLLLAHFFYN